VGKPQVAYRETIRKLRRRRQVHPPDRRLRPLRARKAAVEPNEMGKGFEFINEIKSGAVPRNSQPIEPGREAGDGRRRPGRL